MVKVVGSTKTFLKKCTNVHCGVRLEYTSSDVREYRGTDFSGGSEGRRSIVCPRCGTDVVLRSW